jgi:methionyl-tRNA formyltransferase
VFDLPDSAPDHVIFFGTPDVAVASLVGLVDGGLPVDLVVTGVDKRRGRGSATTPSPVKAAAVDRGIPVVHDLAEVLRVVGTLDGTVLGVVVAYGRLLPSELLEAMPLVNLHFSLLPRWRGAAPVERAILAGDAETGVCLMRVAAELDAGDVFGHTRVPIEDTDTTADLRNKLNHVGVPMLVDACRSGFGRGEAQSGEVSYARKITSEDLRLSWGSVQGVVRRVRVGGAFGFFDGQRLKVHECRIAADHVGPPEAATGEVVALREGVMVRCADGWVEVVSVQPEGRQRMSAGAWWNGLRSSTSVRCFS